MEMFVHFTISSSIGDPEEITRTLSLEPTKSGRAGEIIGRTILQRRRFTIWQIDSRIPINKLDIEQHLDDLLERLWEKQDQIRYLTNRGYNAKVLCAIYFHDREYSFELAEQYIRRLVALNVGFELDCYCIGEFNDFDKESRVAQDIYLCIKKPEIKVSNIIESMGLVSANVRGIDNTINEYFQLTKNFRSQPHNPVSSDEDLWPESQVTQFVAQLWNLKKYISQLHEHRSSMGIKIKGYQDDTNFGVWFNPVLLSQLASLNLNLQIKFRYVGKS